MRTGNARTLLRDLTVHLSTTADYSRNMFPGFGIAVVAFTAYVVYDDFIAKKPDHAHGGH